MTKTTKLTKLIEWSYPTSSNAKRFGFYDTGCYCVETRQDSNPPIARAGFATFEEAKANADKMVLPWDRFTFKLNLEQVL